MFKLYDINLQMFAEANTQTTGSQSLSPEMKTYYSDYLIDIASAKLVHDQFGQKHPIPKNGGKTIEFRKFNPLPKLLTPIVEGVTPDGQSMSVSKIEATVKQYGGYVTLSDMYLLTAIDNNLVHATKLLGNQAGATLDTITREVLNGGNNVVYAGGAEGRSGLTKESVLKVVDVKKAVRALKVQNAPKIGDCYAGIIHPDVTFDLTNDPDWKYPHQYVDTDEIYTGEIGKIAGVRFTETTEAKIFAGNKPFTTNGVPLIVAEDVAAMEDAIKLVDTTYVDTDVLKEGAKIVIGGFASTVGEYDAALGVIRLSNMTPQGNVIKAGMAIVNAGETTSIYSTLILGEDAYGVTEIEGGGLEHITKPLGAGDDPLNQRATCGWKATKVAERLVEQYMVRIESCSTFDGELN